MNTFCKCLYFMHPKHLKSLTLLSQRKFSQNHLLVKNEPSYFLINHVDAISVRLRSSDTQTDLKVTSANSDVLLTCIKTANNTSDVLEMLRLHITVMTLPQHLKALNTIFHLQKTHSKMLSNEDLIRSPEFTALCHKIINHARYLDLNDVLNSIKCLSYLKVSVKSNIMQMMLQIISKMINELSLQQMTFLHFLLKDLVSCPLVDALKLALPIVFETQIRYKMVENLHLEIEFLNYITKHRLSQNTFDLVMSRIVKHFDQINPSLVKNLVCSLYSYGFSTEQYINIINKCLNILITHSDSYLTVNDIEAVLSKMISKTQNESSLFYNEPFSNYIVELLIKKQADFETLSYIIKKFNKIGFVSFKLLNHMTCLLIASPHILSEIKFGNLLSYIAGCAIADYIPPGFYELQPNILKRLNLQKDVLELPWLILALDLVILECWSEELINRIFSRSFLQSFLSRDNQLDYYTLVQLYRAVITLYPGGYKGPLPPDDILEKAFKYFHPNIEDYPLKVALEHGLGGEDYVLTSVRSKLGHLIDHVVVMRPGGYPVSIQKEVKKNPSDVMLEDIVNSSNNKVICIMFCKSTNYSINLERLKGPNAMMIRTIESMGLPVLGISKRIWDSLIDYEKIPYIMRELKSKTELNEKKENI
ncbi:uncharacterized protein LOC126897620 [Daktulosphaira vitifoliae]|uniref:uncharacterized protein LOC126897620 n=1 Tax=Daktulosphaira vitifoliae TaxID=58002 RepID=UPI0021A9A5A8|nr:uncharacterized protein LOC126897620 [Daktulosphaira vitifoliae]XP_050527309.1 uncharacterized protein LOC126897620 [Daktulosphaira vitifoliae]